MVAEHTAVIIGAGPAGLTAAYQLTKAGQSAVVLEADAQYVGGLSRTVEHTGFRFDIGGHRFFSKSKEIEDLWREILGDDLLERPRLSRIYYKGRYFAYPIQAFDAFRKLGPVESARCVLSYIAARMSPTPNPRSFEEWVTNEFGARLYQIFFKTYTEKVWGMSCREISADWAAQRINGLSLRTVLKNALGFGTGTTAKTLIDEFKYPRLGPGMMWERCRDRIHELGGQVHLGVRVTTCAYLPARRLWEVTGTTSGGNSETYTARHVISSAAIADLAEFVHPRLPDEARAAARGLRYRDFITVALMCRERTPLPDNWIYVHDPNVKVGRIQNFKAWSPDMVPDSSMCAFGLEYFCFDGDDLWSSSNEALARLATRELVQLGIIRADDVIDAAVVRQPRAYPVYDDEYSKNVDVFRRAIATNCPGLHLVGRNGMHKYNNQDHSMMTAILTARNILAGSTLFDVWRVNQDAEYHEAARDGRSIAERLTPRSIPATAG